MIEDPLHWPEALTNLVDALRDFIDSDQAMGNSFLADGTITRGDYDRGMEKLKALRELLAELEEHAPDASLNGLQGWQVQ